MTETLTSLLLRLSEDTPPSQLWGRRARPHFGPAFDRLLAAGILVEQHRADSWPPCAHCACGATSRPVVHVGERLVAACLDSADDDLDLCEDDLRRFAVDPRRIVLECLGGVPPEILEPLPMLWARKEADGHYTCMTLQRAVVETPALASVLKQSMPAAGIDFVAPPPAAQTRLRLSAEAPHLTLIPVADAVQVDGLGKLSLSLVGRTNPRPALRLRVCLRSNCVVVDGARRQVPRTRMTLLEMLVDAWAEGRSVPAERISGRFSLRAAKNIVSALRGDLSKGHPNPAEVKGWIRTEHGPTAYGIALTQGQLEVTR